MLALAAALFLTASPAFAGAGPRRNRGAGANANAELLAPLPVPVHRTIALETANGIIDDITRTNSDDGDVIYDVDFTRLGKARNLTVALNGRLLDTLVFLNETPVAVRTTIGRLTAAGNELGDITKNIGVFGDFTYDVETTQNGALRTATVDDNGGLLAMQVFLNESPPSVQKTILAKVGGATLGEIKKSFDEDDVSYDVAMTQAGRRRTFSVSTNGEMEEEQVFADEIPEAVTKAMQTQTKRGRLGKINKSSDEGKDYYEVEVHIGLNTSWVTYDASGAFDSEDDDVDWSLLPAKVKIALHPLQVAGNAVTDITRTTEGTNITFDIELRDGKTRRTMTFDKEGMVIPP